MYRTQDPFEKLDRILNKLSKIERKIDSLSWKPFVILIEILIALFLVFLWIDAWLRL